MAGPEAMAVIDGDGSGPRFAAKSQVTVPCPDPVDWLAVRDRYPGLKRATYLNSCSMGSPSESTLAAAKAFLDQWTGLGASAWYELWLAEMAAWRKNVARLVNARPAEVAWVPSVSAALGSLAGALDRQDRDGKGPWKGRRDVVVGELEFPTAVAAIGVRPATKLQWAKSADGVHIPAKAYAAKMTASTQAVVASRVFYATGAIQPVADICAAARKNGAFAIVDDYQGTGQVPLDVEETGADAVVGGSLKWLCGGVGSAWMVVHGKNIAKLEPTHSGWWANAGMFDFKLGAFRYWDDARRFEGGEAHVPAIFTSNAAVKDQLVLGPKRIHQRNRALMTDLVERLEAKGHKLRIHADASKRSAIVMVRRKDAAKDVARLAKKGIIVDDRPGCVRISPHFYNTEEETQAVVAALGRPS